MNVKFSSTKRGSRGQSLVETAIMLPLLLLILLNVVNFAYFFLVAINLTGAAHTAVLYSIMGGSTPSASELPSSGGASPTTNTLSVTYLAFQDLTGALINPTGASVQVCSPINVNSTSGAGVNSAGSSSQRANCETCTSSSCGSAGNGSPVPDVDPESPNFILNQVRVVYTFNTLFPGRIFNLPLQASAICSAGSCTFVRLAEMRAMN